MTCLLNEQKQEQTNLNKVVIYRKVIKKQSWIFLCTLMKSSFLVNREKPQTQLIPFDVKRKRKKVYSLFQKPSLGLVSTHCKWEKLSGSSSWVLHITPKHTGSGWVFESWSHKGNRMMSWIILDGGQYKKAERQHVRRAKKFEISVWIQRQESYSWKHHDTELLLKVSSCLSPSLWLQGGNSRK